MTPQEREELDIALQASIEAADALEAQALGHAHDRAQQLHIEAMRATDYDDELEVASIEAAIAASHQEWEEHERLAATLSEEERRELETALAESRLEQGLCAQERMAAARARQLDEDSRGASLWSP